MSNEILGNKTKLMITWEWINGFRWKSEPRGFFGALITNLIWKSDFLNSCWRISDTGIKSENLHIFIKISIPRFFLTTDPKFSLTFWEFQTEYYNISGHGNMESSKAGSRISLFLINPDWMSFELPCFEIMRNGIPTIIKRVYIYTFKLKERKKSKSCLPEMSRELEFHLSYLGK